MELSLTTLSENTAGGGDLLAEWGLSILVETDGETILFDTGKNISASHNADTLGIDLGSTSRIVLSHAHYDHTGGLLQALRKIRKEVAIIAHPDVWQAKYARREGAPDRYIGVPFLPQELESRGGIFNLTSQPVKITDRIMTTGEVPMVTDFEEVDPNLWVKGDTGWERDRLLDDRALIINTELGLVVVLGCAHRGIINTLRHAQQLTGVSEIHTVIGGAHLMRASSERLWLTIAALRELDVQRLGLCHCTGQAAAAVMAHEFGERFFFNVAGTRISIE